MKLAIHHRPGSFSDRWIAYCEKKGIDYKIENAFDSDIVQQVSDCDAFMWHHHAQFKDVLTAKRILFALEHAGVKVFPNFKTGWHFDDKVAQKYLLEAIGAPLVPSYVFYDKQEALDWASATSYPKVFKLKGGSGSSNVRLVKNEVELIKLIHRAFGAGFTQTNKFQLFKEHIRKAKEGQQNYLIGLVKGIARLFLRNEFSKISSREREYVYLQDFMPNNSSDTRVVVIGGKRAAAEKRFVRDNDFRASASGKFSYENIDIEIIKTAFELAKRMRLTSVAFDFIYSENKEPLLVEMSYGFGITGIANTPGYWDSDLKWHEGKFIPQDLLVEEVITS